MQFSKKLAPDTITSKHITRYTIQCVNVVKDRTGRYPGKTVMEATDGMKLVVIPCETDSTDVLGMVPAKVLATARKLTKRSDFDASVRLAKRAFVYRYGSIVGTENCLIERRENNTATYPNISMVVPKWTPEAPGTEIHIDARHLLDLQNAMGGEAVTIKFRDAMSPYEITPIGPNAQGFGVLMPVRK